ncbi:hypothetical protein [Maricaulis salignorans]|uniref:Uncharacterized protein n=1 Tax=Maricaulis salignorans TaxID=144026 RepID=A0A1G9Q3P3_9PROT|nr:hypothetical protein [Maricaulis salignorans]SDM05533.1 hypothetical protein SAMN04488568_104147 [Maricaulis salignorans]
MKLNLAIVAGVACWALSSTAQACSLVRQQPQHRPFYAHLVSTAASIELMRVEYVAVGTVEDLSGLESLHPRTSRARVTTRFTSVEAVKGSAGTFEFTFTDGASAQEWDELLASPPEVARHDNHQDPRFWTVFDVYDTEVTPACEIVYPGFVAGDLYVVFRDEAGTPLNMFEMYGRNFAHIEDPENDVWLQALRSLASADAPERGRSVTVEEYLRGYEDAALHEIEACSRWRIGRNTPLSVEPDLHLDEPIDRADRDAELPPGRYWATGLVYGDDPRTCMELDENDEPVSNRCPATIPEQCTPDQSYLLLPAAKYTLTEDTTQYYWAVGLPVSNEGIVDLTDHQTEVELTGNLTPHIDEVRSWLYGD